jgi:serine/threonine protein kinase
MIISKPNIENVQEIFSDHSDIVFHASGGYKFVYIGNIGNDKEALKLIYLPTTDPDELDEMQKRIVREIGILTNCQNDHIVSLGHVKPATVNLGENSFIMYSENFIEGETIAKLIETRYQPTELELKVFTSQMLYAIEEIWTTSQSIHRDIKPQNIIKKNIDHYSFVLFDLGIAFSVIDTSLTRDITNNLPPGTLPYLAPEMFNPNFRDTIDYRSDLYCLGLTIYEFATGIHPFYTKHDHPLTVLNNINKVNPQKIKVIREDISVDFANMIDSWLKKKPHLRMSNFKLLQEKLNE